MPLLRSSKSERGPSAQVRNMLGVLTMDCILIYLFAKFPAFFCTDV